MSKEIKCIGQVFETTNYGYFRFMKENRSVAPVRIKKVKQNIEKNGYIMNPIIVNEKGEIIDGQCRFTVLKEKGMPIQYVIAPNTGAKECIALNTSTTIWGLMDYIESYIEQGNKNYEYLWHLINRFMPCKIGIPEVVFAINGTVDSCNVPIKEGKFICDETQMEYAETLLNYAAKFVPAMSKAQKGRRNLLFIAIMFSKKFDLVDSVKLLDRFERYYTSDIFPFYTNMTGALKAINEIYNYRTSNKIHLEIDYEKYLLGKYKWYEKKWGGDVTTG